MDIGGTGSEEKSGIVRLSAIRQFMAQVFSSSFSRFEC